MGNVYDLLAFRLFWPTYFWLPGLVDVFFMFCDGKSPIFVASLTTKLSLLPFRLLCFEDFFLLTSTLVFLPSRLKWEFSAVSVIQFLPSPLEEVSALPCCRHRIFMAFFLRLWRAIVFFLLLSTFSSSFSYSLPYLLVPTPWFFQHMEDEFFLRLHLPPASQPVFFLFPFFFFLTRT